MTNNVIYKTATNFIKERFLKSKYKINTDKNELIKYLINILLNNITPSKSGKGKLR
jgi:hypothetical protein